MNELKYNYAAQIIEQLLGDDIVVFGTVTFDGEEVDCYIEQVQHPTDNQKRNYSAYRLFIKKNDGSIIQKGFRNSDQGDHQEEIIILSTFKRKEGALETDSSRVNLFIKIAKARNTVRGTTILDGELRVCTLMQRITGIGHPENVIYTVMLDSDEVYKKEREMFRYMKDGTSLYGEDPGIEFWHRLETILINFKDADPEFQKQSEEFKDRVAKIVN